MKNVDNEEPKLFEWIGLKKYHKSDLLKTRLNIISGYQLGTGWGEQYAVMSRFEDALFNICEGLNAYSKHSFKILTPTSSNTSYTLQGSDGSSLYLHPMEFTGYMCDDDINILQEYIKKNCAKIMTICGDPITEQVWDISNWDYKRLLVQNTVGIMHFIETINKNQYAYNCVSPGEYFAEHYRIDRAGDPPCLSSIDIDWDFVDTFDKMLKEIDKDKQIQKTQNQENLPERQ